MIVGYDWRYMMQDGWHVRFEIGKPFSRKHSQFLTKKYIIGMFH